MALQKLRSNCISNDSIISILKTVENIIQVVIICVMSSVYTAWVLTCML